MTNFNLNKITLIIASFLLILIGVLSYLNINSRPTVSTVQFLHNNIDESSLEFKPISNSQIRIFFNRPMVKTDLTETITLIPHDTEFNASWFGNGLVINFKEPLTYNQDYEVKISSGLVDNYQDKPSEEFTYKFKTKSPTIAYIERSEAIKGEKIIKYDLATKQKTEIYRSNKIKFFKNIQNIFAIVTSDGNKDNLVIIDSKNNSVIKDFKFSSSNISDIEEDKYNNRFAIIYQEIIDQDKYFTPINNSRIGIINLSELILKDFTPIENAAGILDILFSKDYSGIIFKLPDSIYYLANIENPSDISSIGKYLYFGNFSKDGSEAVLLEYDPLASSNFYQYIVKLNSERQQTKLTNGENAVIDPRFLNKSNSIYFSNFSEDLLGAKGIYKISKLQENNSTIDILEIQGTSLENPINSLDDSYIALESFNQSQLTSYVATRNFGFQTKPYFGKILIFDVKNNKLINDNLYGVNAIFID